MSIEGLSPYSPTTVYGQLTSPFTPKTITINSHTPYDKVDDKKKIHQRYFLVRILKENLRLEMFMEMFQHKVLMKMI